MPDQTYISLGGGLRLVHESYYVDALGNGMTTEAFRDWCILIGVKLIEIGSSIYVNPHQLEATIAGLMSPSSPYDIVRAPGAESVIRGEAEPTALTREARAAIAWRDVTHQLIAWRKLNGADVGQSARERLKDVARSLAMDVISHRPESSNG